MEENPLEMDLDLMRAIQLSLDQQACSSSTPESKSDIKHRHPSSSSSSASGEEDQVVIDDNIQEVVDDETSLQKALELSYGNMAKGRFEKKINDLQSLLLVGFTQSTRLTKFPRKALCDF